MKGGLLLWALSLVLCGCAPEEPYPGDQEVYTFTGFIDPRLTLAAQVDHDGSDLSYPCIRGWLPLNVYSRYTEERRGRFERLPGNRYRLRVPLHWPKLPLWDKGRLCRWRVGGLTMLAPGFTQHQRDPAWVTAFAKDDSSERPTDYDCDCWEGEHGLQCRSALGPGIGFPALPTTSKVTMNVRLLDGPPADEPGAPPSPTPTTPRGSPDAPPPSP